jgi:hypothetical protein
MDGVITGDLLDFSTDGAEADISTILSAIESNAELNETIQEIAAYISELQAAVAENTVYLTAINNSMSTLINFIGLIFLFFIGKAAYEFLVGL